MMHHAVRRRFNSFRTGHHGSVSGIGIAPASNTGSSLTDGMCGFESHHFRQPIFLCLRSSVGERLLDTQEAPGSIPGGDTNASKANLEEAHLS